MDLLKDKVYARVVGYFYNDQGLDIPEKFKVKLADLDFTKQDLDRGRVYLSSLTESQFQNFCIGDEQYMKRMARKGGKDAEAAHRVLDELFMLIGG
jgi:hypothetical protein